MYKQSIAVKGAPGIKLKFFLSLKLSCLLLMITVVQVKNSFIRESCDKASSNCYCFWYC
jgi:hypothetical protein